MPTSKPFMRPWQESGAAHHRLSAAAERRPQQWWESVVWVSAGIRFVLPSLLLCLFAWLSASPIEAREPGLAPVWWRILLVVALFNAWHAYRPLLIFLRALKERLYRRAGRIAADLGMAFAWTILAGLAWTLLDMDCGSLHPPAACVALWAGALGLAFWVHALVGLVRGGRALRLVELSPDQKGEFVRPAGFRGSLRVAHLSDLHLTEHGGVLAVSGGLGGNAQFKALLDAHASVLKRQDAVILTGDVTDAGRATEWKAFFAAWERLGLAGRGILVPGNHEVNIIDPADRVAVDPAHVLRAKRLVRTLAALDRMQGDRAWVWGAQGPELLRDHLARHAYALETFVRDPSLGTLALPWMRLAGTLLLGSWKPASRSALRRLDALNRLWQGCFPMLVSIPKSRALALVLDSNVAATGIWDNALGELKPAQLRRLKLLLSHPRFAGSPKPALLHHHVALPPLNLSVTYDFKSDLMSLLNARDLVDALPPGRQLILHGHKHLSYFGHVARRIQVVSAPSSTLPDERHPSKSLGFYTLSLALGADQVALAGAPRFHPYTVWPVK
jgi:3',5'-cyclic AMP phosphodiesterase CpdA